MTQKTRCPLKQTSRQAIWGAFLLFFLLPVFHLNAQDQHLEINFLKGGKLDLGEGGPQGFGFTENGRYIYGYNVYNNFQLWDLASGKMLPSSVGGDNIVAASLSPDARFIVYEYAATEDITMVEDLLTGKSILDLGYGINHFHLTANAEILYFLVKDYDDEMGPLYMEDLKLTKDQNGITQLTKANKKSFNISVANPQGIEIQSDSRFFYYINANGSSGWNKIGKIDIKSGREVLSFGPENKKISGISLVYGQAQLLIYLEEGPPELWDTRSGNKIASWDKETWEGKKTFKGDYKCVPLGFGAQLTVGEDQSRVKIWNMRTGELINEIKWKLDLGEYGEETTIELSPDGNYLLNQGMEVWDVQTGRRLYDLGTGRTANSYNQLSLDSKNKELWLGIAKDSFLRWDLEEGKMDPTIHQRKVPNSGIRKIVFEPETSEDPQLYEPIREKNEKYGIFWERTSAEYECSETFTINSGEILERTKYGGCVTWEEYLTGCILFPDIGQKGLLFISDKTEGLYSLDLASPPNGKKTYYQGEASANNLDVFEELDLLVHYSDNATRIWKLTSGKLLASLYRFGDTGWVVISPEGYFDYKDASIRPMDDLYFTVFENNEWEVIELDQLKGRYWEPGLLSKVLGYGDETLRDVATLGKVKLYPKIKATISKDLLNIQLEARSGGIGKVSVFVHNKELMPDANTARKTDLSVDLKQFDKYYVPGENKISIRAYNAEDWLKSSEIVLSYTPGFDLSEGSESTSVASSSQLGYDKISLYVVSVGTANYNGDALDLNFAGKDAVSIEAAFKEAGGQLFEDRVFTYLLTTEEASIDPTKSNIHQVFNEIAGKAKPHDILLIYLSGHGVSYGSAEKANFYYLTKDISSVDISDTKIRENSAISDNELTQWMLGIRALKQVMIIDACNAGKVVENLLAGKKKLNSTQIRALDRMKDRTGMFVLAGSAADKVSLEANEFGQGLLTYSLLNGMKSKLAIEADGRVDIMKLFQYSRDEVPNLAKRIKRIQTPMLAFPTEGSSFDIGIVNSTVNIPVPNAKPVFIRSAFQDEDAYNDILQLSDKLNQHLDDLNKGSRAKLVYIPVSSYNENSYSIKGRYKQSGDTVKLTARFFKGDNPIAPIELSGNKNDLNGLIKQIMSTAYQLLDQ